MYDENKKEKPWLKEVEPSIFMDSDSQVKKLFICRAVLWAVALAATVYWIWWSFEIYNRGICRYSFRQIRFKRLFRFD